MNFDNINISMSPNKINYSEAKFNQMIVREVYSDGYPNGTYHIKPTKVRPEVLVKFLRKEIPYADVDLVDPGKDLNPDYPVYLISYTNRKAIIMDIQNADNSLSDYIKNRTNHKKGDHNE